MNPRTNENSTTTVLAGSNWLQIFPSPFAYPLVNSSPRSNLRLPNARKPLSELQIIEICFLCVIFLEHTMIFILTFRKKSSKQTIFRTNDQQQQTQRSIILPAKSLLYNCLHRNWIRAYSFSHICLSLVYLITSHLKYRHPNLVHYSSITFYSLPLTLVQQILINFNAFHLLIISISTLQYFIRSYRLLTDTYSINIYNGRNLLITKHTNVALILSGSLALIFGYNYIFYVPRYAQTLILLPLITLNMVLLPLIDVIIFIFIIICCLINRYQSSALLATDLSFNNQSQQRITDNLRSMMEKSRCIKCYSKFLQQNRNLLQDTDPYTKLHSRFFSHNLISSTRSSITPPNEIRKYSTISYENIPMINEHQSRLRASYPCQTTRSFLAKKSHRAQQEVSIEQRTSTNDLFLQTALIKLKQKRSLCRLCYRLLLLFLLKYVVFTFPQHCHQMIVYVKQLHHYIRHQNPLYREQPSTKNEFQLTVLRLLFLAARFGDSLLLTCLPKLIKKYFPCWCQFNSTFLRQSKPTERISHQVLMRNTESSTNEPMSADEYSISHELTNQQDFLQRRQSTKHQISRTQTRHFRLRFQFIPIWSKKREKFFRETS